MSYAVLFVTLLATSSCWGQDQLTCGRGQWVNGSTCSPCPHDMFMDEDNHTHISCYHCFTNDIIEKKNAMRIITACNTTHQAMVGCIEGYFHVPASISRTSPGECDSCQNCSDVTGYPFQVQKCFGRFDTVCCEKEDMKADLVGDKYECRESDAGSTDGKTQGPDVTVESKWGTSTISPSKRQTNTTTSSTHPNNINKKSIMPDWAIALLVIVIVVSGVIVFIVCYIKKCRKPTHVISFNAKKVKESEEKDGGSENESKNPLNPA